MEVEKEKAFDFRIPDLSLTEDSISMSHKAGWSQDS